MVVTSPLPYLFDEDRRGDRQAREALFCTFNADLGYFERSVLGVTQSTGARVTVVGDGRISDPDPRAARNAGTRYVHGLAVTDSGAAFHPKVNVVVGRDRAVVAIGSGNLSPGGWHLNKETWTVATANRERCPVVVTGVAAWLRTLDEVCAITPQAVEGINRTATHLEQLIAAATVVDTGHRLVHTSTASLLEQLPGGDVDRLLLYAPFHDERAAAVRQLIERLQPNSVTLAVQSRGQTVIQPDAIRRVVTDLGVQLDVVEDAEERYRHGKLVEAIGPDGSRWTLTGSPNLSARALLRAAEHGGNIEVGVVSRPGVSLFPEGRPIELSEVTAVRIDGPAISRPAAGVTLLAAVRVEGGLEVVFSKPLSERARIMASAQADFEQWAEIGLVPIGVTAHVLDGIDLPGGTRIRCKLDAGSKSAAGGIVFVIDREQVMRRPGETAWRGGVDAPGPAALITDPRLLELWLSALSEIASSPAGAKLPRMTTHTAPSGESEGTRPGGGLRLDTDDENWLASTDDAKAGLGSAMFYFAMGGLAGLRASASTTGSGLREPTDKLLDESRPGLDEDDAATVGDHENPGDMAGLAGAAVVSAEFGGPGVDYFNELAERERRRVRRRLESSVATEMAAYPAFSRLAILILVLCAVEAGLWDDPLGDQGWIGVVSEALEKLDQEDIPTRLSSTMASWAAVATYLLHEHRPTAGRTREVLMYERAADSVSHLFPDADADLVEDLAEPFTNRNGYPVDPDAVMHVISRVVQADPLSEAIDIVEAIRPAWSVHRHSALLLHVHGKFRATFLPAAEVLDAVPGPGTAAVLATGTAAGWTIAIRDEDSLIRVEKDSTGRVTWWHYRLSNLVSPTVIARDHELASWVRKKYQRLDQHFPAALEALARAGIDLSGDPAADCPPGVS